MSLKKLREWVIEAKLYFARTYSYLVILNFLMIVLIFFNTTLWEYGAVQQIFHDRKTLMIVGTLAFVVLTAIVGYVDTKLKLWRTESERAYTPERNPLFVPMVLQCAKIINDLKKEGKDTTALDAEFGKIFERCKLRKEFELFKEQTK
jgi:hypothetical protein